MGKKLTAVKEKIANAEALLNRMEFQHEVLQQQLTTVSAERDELYGKFQHAIYDVQRKSGLKNLILEKKIDSIEEVLEIVATMNADDATTQGVSQRLDQVLQYKNDIVAQLEEEVQRIKDSHRTMVRTYESKLAEYGIPAEELGFTPNVD